MDKYLVTGGAGFIGSHLTDALVGAGHEVHVIDNLSLGKREQVHPKAIFHEVDIRNFDALLSLCNGIDAIFHLAALPRVTPSIADPRTAHDVNSTGTLNVLVAARDAGVKRVVYSASSSAYGDQSVLPLREEMEPNPMSPYALQKYTGELAARLFAKLYGIQTVSLRYFNVYGPRMPTSGAYAIVIGIFLDQRKRGEPMTIVPDGLQTRDFTHVRDVVRANILAAQSPRPWRGEMMNIGTGKNYTIRQIADMIGGPTVFIDARIEPKHTRADITRAADLLAWMPEVSFEDGVAELKKMYGLA